MRCFLLAALLLAIATPAFAAPPALRLDGTANAALRTSQLQPRAIALPIPMGRTPRDGASETPQTPRGAIATAHTARSAE